MFGSHSGGRSVCLCSTSLTAPGAQVDILDTLGAQSGWWLIIKISMMLSVTVIQKETGVYRETCERNF